MHAPFSELKRNSLVHTCVRIYPGAKGYGAARGVQVQQPCLLTVLESSEAVDPHY